MIAMPIGTEANRRTATITKAEVKRILTAAQEVGITLGIVVKPGEVHFAPIDTIENAQTLNPLDKWKAKRDARDKRS